LKLKEEMNFDEYNAIVLAVTHEEYKKLDLIPSDKQVIFNIKSVIKNSNGGL